MSKEDKNASIDTNSADERLNQELLLVQKNKESLAKIKPQLEEVYSTRICFTNEVNEANNRRVNLPLVLAQFFGRYSAAQIIGFLTGAVFLIAIQGKQLESDSSVSTILFMGTLTTILMIAFIGITLKNVISAMKDIRRIKNGFCSLGYQILISDEDNQAKSGTESFQLLIAYKDYADMIRTINLPVKDYKKYFPSPVLELFLDNSNPHNVTFLDVMPKDISYNSQTKLFYQSWKELVYTLFPIAMIILYAISMHMCYIAYAAHH